MKAFFYPSSEEISQVLGLFKLAPEEREVYFEDREYIWDDIAPDDV